MTPDKSQFVRDFVGPRLALVGDIEDTRRNSFEAVRAGCVEVRKDDPRWGLLEKTSGSNVNGFAADIWVYDLLDGRCQVVDIVSNAEGESDPPGNPDKRTAPVASWQEKDIRPISQWRTPAGTVPTPDPEPEPDPGTDELEARVFALEQQVESLQRAVIALSEQTADAIGRADAALLKAGQVDRKLTTAQVVADPGGPNPIETNKAGYLPPHVHQIRAKLALTE